MIKEIFDILNKKEGDRILLGFLTTQIIFCVGISTKIYEFVHGKFIILKPNNYEGLVDYFTLGLFFKCLTIFLTVWFASYVLFPLVVRTLLILPANKYIFGIKKITGELAVIEEGKVIEQLSKNIEFKKLVSPFEKFFERYNILTIENETVKLGSAFDKFYKYIKTLEEDEKQPNSEFYMTYIILNVQLIILYNWYDFSFTMPFFAVFLVCLIISHALALIALAGTVIAENRYEAIGAIINNIKIIVNGQKGLGDNLLLNKE